MVMKVVEVLCSESRNCECGVDLTESEVGFDCVEGPRKAGGRHVGV